VNSQAGSPGIKNGPTNQLSQAKASRRFSSNSLYSLCLISPMCPISPICGTTRSANVL
jgi:hypothetical protein